MSDSLRVRVRVEPTTADLDTLRAGLAPGVELSFGDGPGDFDVLVAGRPTEALLQQTRRALVIPFSGLPLKTRDLILHTRPDLRVYNLHHNADAVAEHAVAMALAAAHCLVPMHQAMARMDWRPRYAPDPAVGLAGRRALVLGWGAIGRGVGARLTALGMRVRGIRRTRHPDEPPSVGTAADLPRWLPEADLLVLCLPHTPQTAGLVDAAALGALPRGAIVVNVGRAAVLDPYALHAALVSGHLHSAALDTWWRYPATAPARVETPPAPVPLWRLPNVLLSPHRAGHGAHVERARQACLALVLGQLHAGQEPSSRVDVQRGY